MNSDRHADAHDGHDTDAAHPDDPYPFETVELAADGRDNQKLSDLLGAQVVSNQALGPLTSSNPEAGVATTVVPPTLTERLLPQSMRRTSSGSPLTDERPPTLDDGDEVDLAFALGVQAAAEEATPRTFLETLLVWLIDVVNQGRTEAGLDEYCDVLLRAAEEAGERGMAALAALTLRYRRVLQRADGDDPGTLGLALLEWPMLVAAYVTQPADPHRSAALLAHVAAAQDEGDATFDDLGRLGSRFAIEASQAAPAPALDQETLTLQAGESVFHASRVRVYGDSLQRRMQRLTAVCKTLLAELPDAHQGDLMLTYLRAVEDRIDELRTSAHSHHRLSRHHHRALAGSLRSPLDRALQCVLDAARAGAAQRGSACVVTVAGGAELLDRDAVQALAGPLSDVASWLARHGSDDPTGAATHLRLSCARDGHGIRLDLHAEAPALCELADVIDQPDAWSTVLAQRLLDLCAAATATPAATRSDPMTELGLAFDALTQGALGLGGHARLRFGSDQRLLLRVHIPDWLAITTGRLVPAAGGLLTVRESGITDFVNIAEQQLQPDGNRTYLPLEGTRYRAVSLLPLLGLQDTDASGAASAQRCAMLMHSAEGPMAVIAAGVSEPLRFPVRALGERLPALPGIVGGTVLMGGEVSPLIDLPSVWDAYLRDQQRRREAAGG